MTSPTRSNQFEVWSCTPTGEAIKHGTALGLTFDDACKHVATASIDFWTHFDRGRYRGQALYPSRREALAARKPK